MSEEKGRAPVDKTVAMPAMGRDTLTSIATEGMSRLADAATFRAARPRVVLANEAIRQIVDIDRVDFVFGRNPAQGADCLVDHPAVSGAHTRVGFREDRFYVEDLGSRNHTFVGDEMLSANVPHEIDGETPLRIGAVEALFVTDCDAQGRRADPRRYRCALDLLETQGRITGVQRDRAEREAREQGRHPGEILLLHGDLRVDDWMTAFNRGEMFELIRREADRKTRKLGLVVLIQALVIVALIAILVTKPDLIASLWGGGR